MVCIASIIVDQLDGESLHHVADESHVRLAALLETKVAYCVRANHIVQSLEKKRKRRLEIDTVSRQDDIRVCCMGMFIIANLDGWRAAPIVDEGLDMVLEVIESDIPLHQRQHGDLIRDIQFLAIGQVTS